MKKKKSLFPLAGISLEDPVKGRKGRAEKLQVSRAKLRAIVERHTESMVKISGGTTSISHMKSHMNYISRNGKISLENEKGEMIDDKEKLSEVHAQWADDLGKPRKNEKHTIHIVLSMPSGTDPEAVRRGARNFAKDTFGMSNEYLMALHHPGNDPDTKQPHVHLTVKSFGFDGSRLDPRKDDLRVWRERFAEKMVEQGYNVVATPRLARGIVLKPQKSAIYAMENDTQRPGRSTTQAKKLIEAGEHLKGNIESVNPYKETIIAKQNAYKLDYLTAADELEKTGDADDAKLAKQVRDFVSQIPSYQDEREVMRKQLLEKIQGNRESTKGQGRGDKER